MGVDALTSKPLYRVFHPADIVSNIVEVIDRIEAIEAGDHTGGHAKPLNVYRDGGGNIRDYEDNIYTGL